MTVNVKRSLIGNINKIFGRKIALTLNLLIHFGIITFTLLCILACDDASNDNISEIHFKKNLIERRIGESNYFIFLPQDYSLHQNNGPDFSVFYISPSDSTQRANFSGGIYFGNHANKFKVDKNNCKQENLKTKILGKELFWSINNCKSNYMMQMLIKNHNNISSIHLWGFANNRTELNKMMIIFSTLYEKNLR